MLFNKYNFSIRSLFFSTFAICIITAIYLIWPQTSANKENQFTVAMMSGWAPFMIINNQGNYEGFDVAVAQEIARRMNKELVIKDMGSLAPTFIALDQESVDAVMSGLDITDVRRKKLTLIPYSGEDVTNFTLLFWQNLPNNITTIQDLANQQATICAEPGSAQAKFLDTIAGIQEKSLSKLEEMILDIKYGKSDAMLVEPRIANRLQKLEPQLIALNVPLPREYQTFGYGIAIKPNNTELAKQMNNTISEMKTDGTLTTIKQQWQMEE